MADRRTGKRKGSSADGQVQETRLVRRAQGANRMQKNESLFPTPQHEDAARYTTEFFSKRDSVNAVLLTCSCARGKAAPESCVDISVLLKPDTEQVKRQELEKEWQKHSEGSSVVTSLAAHGPYAHIDIDLTDGQFKEGYHGWCSGPDEFELEIGNLLQYSKPLYEEGNQLADLKETWLPYYYEELRARRLAMVHKYCLNNIDHIASFVDRGLCFQGFRRLYNAAGEFLQALFIAKRVYPIAYHKWIKEQLEEVLGMPDLYAQFVDIHSIENFESAEIKEKSEVLLEMFKEHCTET